MENNRESKQQTVRIKEFTPLHFGYILVSSLLFGIITRVLLNRYFGKVYHETSISLFRDIIFYGFILFLLYLKGSKREWHDLVGNYRTINNKGQYLSIVLTLLLLSYGVGYLLSYFIHCLSPAIAQELFLDKELIFSHGREQSNSIDIMIFLSTCLLVPIVEELLFRGFYLKSLLKKNKVLNSLVITSVVFGLLHFPMVIGSTIFSFILGLVYLKSKSILFPITLHCLYNSALLICIYIFERFFPDPSPVAYVFPQRDVVIGSVAFVSGVLLLLHLFKKKIIEIPLES